MKDIDSNFLGTLVNHGYITYYPEIFFGSDNTLLYSVERLGNTGVVSIKLIESYEDIEQEKSNLRTNLRYYVLDKKWIAPKVVEYPPLVYGWTGKKPVVAKRVEKFVPKKSVKAKRVKSKSVEFVNPYIGTQKEVLFKMIKYHSGLTLPTYARIVSAHGNFDVPVVLRWMQRRISELIRENKVVFSFDNLNRKLYKLNRKVYEVV